MMVFERSRQVRSWGILRMHALGHTMIWLIAVGALAASVLTAKTYEVRNSWIKKVDQLENDVEKNKPVIAEKEVRLEALREKKDQLTLGWDEPILGVSGQLNDSFGFGTDDARVVNWLASLDQAQQAAQVIYLFLPQADGSSQYVGSFQLAGPVNQGGRAAFEPTWTVRQEDFERIQNPQGPFRVRPMVPSHFPSKYAEMRREMTVTERHLADKQDDLAEQKQRQIDAQKILAERTEQLQGPDGLVSQMQSAEDERNVELEELDYWRRKVDDARQEIENLLEENRQIEQQIESSADSQAPVTAQIPRR